MIASTSSHPAFRPGERAQTTGIYRATHVGHRMPHEITVLEGETFPPCKRCGQNVRFELLHAAPRVAGDIDLLLALCAFGAALFCCIGFR